MSDDVGSFLKSRRARLEPEDVGLPARLGRSRVAGLRREDVAILAHVSVDYYTRLEQGRASAVSDSVLDAIARALRLDAVERQHLSHLAHPMMARPRSEGESPPPLRAFAQLLRELRAVPALVIDQAMDVLAVNAVATELFGIRADSGRPVNAARYVFAAAEDRLPIRNRSTVAAAAIAYLRYQQGRLPGDRRIDDVITELSARSGEFRRLWAQQDVRGASPIQISLEHPVVGVLELHNLWLTTPLHPDAMVICYLANEGSATEQRLAELAARLERTPADT